MSNKIFFPLFAFFIVIAGIIFFKIESPKKQDNISEEFSSFRVRIMKDSIKLVILQGQNDSLKKTQDSLIYLKDSLKTEMIQTKEVYKKSTTSYLDSLAKLKKMVVKSTFHIKDSSNNIGSLVCVDEESYRNLLITKLNESSSDKLLELGDSTISVCLKKSQNLEKMVFALKTSLAHSIDMAEKIDRDRENVKLSLNEEKPKKWKWGLIGAGIGVVSGVLISGSFR